MDQNYKVYVFDLDGTLYDQPRLRLGMMMHLAGFYILHPLRIKELLLLQTFRKVKDNWDESVNSVAEEELAERDEKDNHANNSIDALDKTICRYIADKKNVSVELVTGVVYKWIYKDPLELLHKVRDVQLIERIALLRESGKKVIVWSDYPVDDKLRALECEVDAVYSSTDERIMELKPSPKALRLIMQEHSVDNKDIIMIGDRYEKDAKAAIAADVDYLILERNVQKRKY